MKASLEHVRTRMVRHTNGAPPKKCVDALAVEEPLEIQVDARPVSVTMRTPGHDDELAAGFLLTEGLITRRADIVAIKSHPRNKGQNVLNFLLSPEVTVDFAQLTRHVFASSSCGLCGKATIDAVHQHFPPVRGKLRVAAATILALPAQMRRQQKTFERTGGLHAAAVFDAEGKLIVLREDVGRHNAVDKVLGHGLLTGRLPFDKHILLVSGRASFEILQKALAARVTIIAAVSAPTNLAVEFARASRQTLVGFLRAQTMNIYARPERILGPR